MEFYNPNVEEIYYIGVTSKDIKSSKEAYFNTIKIIPILELEKKLGNEKIFIHRVHSLRGFLSIS